MIFKIGDVVRVKNETIQWHKNNNTCDHIPEMNAVINEVGIINAIDEFNNTRVMFHGGSGRCYWWFSENCLEFEKKPDTRTNLSKLINKIYIKEKSKHNNL